MVETSKIKAAADFETPVIDKTWGEAHDQVVASFDRELKRRPSIDGTSPTRKADPLATLVRKELLTQQYNNM